MQMLNTISTLKPAIRHCLREPIPEIDQAARMLTEAVSAHQYGDEVRTKHLIRLANMKEIREWTNSLWGKSSPYVQYRGTPSAEPYLPKIERHIVRMPTLSERCQLHQRDGYHCRFCGIPVMRKEVRRWFTATYPDLAIWGKTYAEQHAAFQAIWAQYDHVVPHARGGDNNPNNIIVACAPFNFGRMSYTLEEVYVMDPRNREPVRSQWDGLESVFLAS